MGILPNLTIRILFILAVKPMGADFVYGFVQSMDTEKDPRNLIIAFSCVTTIAQHFPLGKCVC